jgi:hypothetical protein
MKQVIELSKNAKDSEPYLLIQECYRVLRNCQSNVVWEILRQSGEFVQWTHYPKGEVFDRQTHSQYYYHAHPSKEGNLRQEHGHFHVFLNKSTIPAECHPVSMPNYGIPEGSQTYPVCHLIGIAMDNRGSPIRLFTTNRWVTAETWYAAETLSKMIGQFAIDHAYPSWPCNIWLTSMVKLFKTTIIALLHQRDAVIAAWQTQHPQVNAYEDRKLEILSSADITF